MSGEGTGVKAIKLFYVVVVDDGGGGDLWSYRSQLGKSSGPQVKRTTQVAAQFRQQVYVQSALCAIGALLGSFH